LQELKFFDRCSFIPQSGRRYLEQGHEDIKYYETFEIDQRRLQEAASNAKRQSSAEGSNTRYTDERMRETGQWVECKDMAVLEKHLTAKSISMLALLHARVRGCAHGE
jgi:hypothetical protein